MLDKDKIIKIELTSPTGRKLAVAEKDQFSFPKMYIDDRPVDNIIIIKGRDLPDFKIEQSVYIITYMKNGDRIRYVGVIRMSLPYQINVQLRNEYGTLMAERRRYFKVETDNMTCTVSGYTHDDELFKYEMPIDAVIKNISIGGIFLICTTEKFSPQDVLLINFNIGGKDICVTAKILRAQNDANGSIEGYGCQFINTDKNTEEQFAKLVYEIQLKQRNEQMERDEQRLGTKGFN